MFAILLTSEKKNGKTLLFVIKQRTVLKKDSYTKRCRDTKGHGTAFFMQLIFFLRDNVVGSREKGNIVNGRGGVDVRRGVEA